MAEGVLILLVDEENKNRKKYQGLDKEYEFEVLFGAATDTYDLLGIIKNPKSECRNPKQIRNSKVQNPKPQNQPPITLTRDKRFGHLNLGNSCLFRISDFVLRIFARRRGNTSWWDKNLENKIKRYAINLIGVRQQPYPPFSSFQIQKKPLFQWAKEGKLNQIKIPTKEIEIYNIKHLGTYEIGSEELYQLIIGRVSKVRGKFRQKEILRRWEMFFEESVRGRFGSESRPQIFNSQFSIYNQIPIRQFSKVCELVHCRFIKNCLPHGISKKFFRGLSKIANWFRIPKQVRDDESLAFPVMRFWIHCSSGTYVRAIAHEMGRVAGLGALALSIKRTRVGKYKIADSITLSP